MFQEVLNATPEEVRQIPGETCMKNSMVLVAGETAAAGRSTARRSCEVP